MCPEQKEKRIQLMQGTALLFHPMNIGQEVGTIVPETGNAACLKT